jgi:hypothetical protein
MTDKLWEVSDIVEMLEQWELANFKPEYQFVVRQYAIGKGIPLACFGAAAKSIRSSDLKRRTMHCSGSKRSHMVAVRT